MDKILDMMTPTTEELTKNNISPQQWQEFSILLKQRTQFYKEENARLEAIFKKLKLLNDELKLLNGISDSVSKLNSVVQKAMTKSLNNNSVTLSHAEKLRKHSNYVSKLKICIKFYMNLNEKLSKEIKATKWEMDQSKTKLGGILNLSVQDLQQMEEKAKKYENELLKFEKKYPWLKDPEINLPNIAREIDTLRNLKEEKNKLVKELNVYQELKPDIKEAAQQLANLKLENKHLSSMCLDNKC
ncbi:uncharacterized protein LOC108911359 [Anoplophora glabripennis]|uniref:uncharacterized protein LOC108911359 n=1 Tax=Anoplophora glabripennis TaxID=217634 RepID=UPI000874D994|nr:uncharacterized protein LOC108911359 [Anoplophora glabripennis]